MPQTRKVGDRIQFLFRDLDRYSINFNDFSMDVCQYNPYL
jgi:hypothetical protein